MISCALHRLAIYALLGFFLTPTAAQRAPNGSVGTIDFRYPDYIVTPRVECPFEGVFPHPRDCRWYYRCYDTFGFGYYWRAYFECEPGTAFSDALDQCVFQGDGHSCLTEPDSVNSCREELLGCREEDICTPSSIGTSFIYRTEVCRSAQKICSGFPNEALCRDGYLYDTGKRQCIEEGALCQPSTPRPPSDFPLTCQDELSGCFDINICPLGQAPEARRLCYVNRYCYHQDGRVKTTNKCPEDYQFDVFANECVDTGNITQEDINLCNDDVDLPEALDCVVESESCSVYQSCETRESFLGCVSSFMCGVAAPRSNVCPYGAVYVPKTDKCIHVTSPRTLVGQPPGGILSPCVFTNIESPPLPIPSPVIPSYNPEYPPLPVGFDDVNDYIKQYQCSGPGDVPTAPRHRSLTCKDRKRCLASGEEENYNVCRKYYVCGQDNTLSIKDCRKKSFFDFSSKSCKPLRQLPGSKCRRGSEPTTPSGLTLPPTSPEISEYNPEYPPLPMGLDDVSRFIYEYRCSAPGEVPVAPRHPALMCTDRKRCFSTGNEKTYNVCQKFFVCDPFRSTLTMNDCGENSFFDFSSKSCKPLNKLPGMQCLDDVVPSTPDGETSPPPGGSTPDVTDSTPQEESPPGGIISPPDSETQENEGEMGENGTNVTNATVEIEGETEDSATASVTEPSPGVTSYPGDSSPDVQPVVTPQPLNVIVDSTVTCKSDGEFGEMDEIAIKNNCERVPICNAGKFVGIETRCSTFYRCVLSPDGYGLKPESTECNAPGELFFPDKKRCEVPTKEVCGTAFFYWVSQRNAYEVVQNTRENIEKISLQEKLRHNAQTSGPNYVPQIQPNQNYVQQQSFAPQQPSNAWNSWSQQQYNPNFVQQYQTPQALINEGKHRHTLNPHVPEPQQFGVMPQKHEQARQPNVGGSLFQYPGAEQTLRQANEIHQSGYPQPQFQPNNVSPLTLFSGQNIGNQGFLNPSISVNRGLGNHQTLGPKYSNAPGVNNFQQKEASFRTSDGQPFGSARHHSNPGIPNHAFMSHHNVRPQNNFAHQIPSNEGNFLNRISETPEVQHQPLTNFQQQYPFLGNIQNPQNQVHQFNSA